MRIGEILLEHEWVVWEAFALALDDHMGTDTRLCSLLVVRGLVEFDHASLALAEQHGVAAALKKHLAVRDKQVASLLPGALARRLIAIPIGRKGDGTLIVCARDPVPAVKAELERAIGEPILLAVAPASYLERLVEVVYEVDVPIEIGEPVRRSRRVSDFDIDIEEPVRRSRRVSDFDIDIDDSPADDLLPIEIEAPDPAKPKSRALPVQIKAAAAASRDSLDATIASFPDIDDIEWLLDVVMGYIAKRWQTALILTVTERRATGVRGHGRKLKPSITRAFGLALSELSIVQSARDERRLVTDSPFDAGKGHASLVDLLEDPPHLAAAPVERDGAVSHVIVVGEPTAGDADSAALDLEVLAEAMSTAVERLG